MDALLRPLTLIGLGALALLAPGCRTVPPPVRTQPASFSSTSSYSAASAYEPLAVTGGAALSGEIVVRPDRVVQSFAIRTREGTARDQFESLRAAASAVEARFIERTGGAARVEIVGMRLERRAGKVRTGGLVAVLDGEVVLPLPAEADVDVWSRARALVGLQETAALLAEEGLEQGDVREYSFAAPAPSLSPAQLESHRAQLVAQWASRARQFTQAASHPAAPLAVVDCRAVPELRQRVISLERIALSVEAACRIDVVTDGERGG